MVDLRPALIVLTLGLAGCSSGDYGPTTAAAPPQPGSMAPSPPAAPTVVRSDLPAPVAHTGADGYPNVNVDTAAPVREPVRSAEERDRLEAELMALGARQRSSAGGAPQSVIQELQDLGRRSKAEAERQIESGKAPATP